MMPLRPPKINTRYERRRRPRPGRSSPPIAAASGDGARTSQRVARIRRAREHRSPHRLARAPGHAPASAARAKPPQLARERDGPRVATRRALHVDEASRKVTAPEVRAKLVHHVLRQRPRYDSPHAARRRRGAPSPARTGRSAEADAGRRAWPAATRTAVSKPRAHHASLRSRHLALIDTCPRHFRPALAPPACPVICGPVVVTGRRGGQHVQALTFVSRRWRGSFRSPLRVAKRRSLPSSTHARRAWRRNADRRSALRASIAT